MGECNFLFSDFWWISFFIDLQDLFICNAEAKVTWFCVLRKKAIMLNLGASLFFEIGSLSNSGCLGICCLDQAVLELREPLAPASWLNLLGLNHSLHKVLNSSYQGGKLRCMVLSSFVCHLPPSHHGSFLGWEQNHEFCKNDRLNDRLLGRSILLQDTYVNKNAFCVIYKEYKLCSWGQPGPHIDFQDSQKYMRDPVLKRWNKYAIC